MARPKSDDPKVAVTIRVKASTMKRYEMLGPDWRQQMEAAVERFGHPARAPSAPEKLARPRPFVSRLKGEWKAP